MTLLLVIIVYMCGESQALLITNMDVPVPLLLDVLSNVPPGI